MEDMFIPTRCDLCNKYIGEDEFDNGREYHPLHGKRLQVLPDASGERPSRAFIDWHNEKVFVG